MKPIHQAYRYEIRPNESQLRAFGLHVAMSHGVYNWGLWYCKMLHEREPLAKCPTHFDLCAAWVKWKAEHRTLADEVSSLCVQAALRQVAWAYKNFFRGLREGRKIGFPRSKDRFARKSFYAAGGIKAEGSRVRLPRIGWMSTKETTRVKGRIESATVAEDCGRWYVSFRVERMRVPPGPRGGGIVGVDMGLKTFAVLSNGEQIESPRPYREATRQLARAQRVVSRRERGSGRWFRAKAKLQGVHRHVGNVRRDFLHRTTTALAKRFDVIAVETLTVKNLMGNHALAGAIADQGWAEFRRQLGYKSAWYGSRLVEAPTSFPSTRTCNVCGVVGPKVPLKERMFRCGACGHEADRDLNAAGNLESFARSTATQAGIDARGEAVSPRVEGAGRAAEAASLKREGGRVSDEEPVDPRGFPVRLETAP